ncbi:MAG: aminodeoxychorismate synthase component I [Flavobacteriaceae bacterium]
MQSSFTTKIAGLMASNSPFFFVVDFEKTRPQVFSWEEAIKAGYQFDIHGKTNAHTRSTPSRPAELNAYPMSEEQYTLAFNQVKRNLNLGNSFLVNLTFPTPIRLNESLAAVFDQAKAPYKLYKKNDFVVFSPECFIKIKEGYIYTYPMKGTIDAITPNALEELHQNRKEQYEHNTIVDLLRNDLSQVAREVTVTRFRYPQKLTTQKGELIQTSSEIRGKLHPNWKEELGEILLSLLPAGSISGAPKEKTCAIIREAEGRKRGYFTGVFGVFDGRTLDSGVMIRYIEQRKGQTFFRSGGGITSLSEASDEYHELLQKVYLPVF